VIIILYDKEMLKRRVRRKYVKRRAAYRRRSYRKRPTAVYSKRVSTYVRRLRPALRRVRRRRYSKRFRVARRRTRTRIVYVPTPVPTSVGGEPVPKMTTVDRQHSMGAQPTVVASGHGIPLTNHVSPDLHHEALGVRTNLSGHMDMS